MILRTWLAVLGLGASLSLAQPVGAASPYPQSREILGITWDFAGAVLHRGSGSDLWPFAWGSTDTLYAAYGDGGGFNGNDVKCRTHMGVHTVTGSPPAFTTFANTFGCQANGTHCDTGARHDPVCDAQFGQTFTTDGVPDGLVAYGTTLYSVTTDPGVASRVIVSTDGAHTWSQASWTFPLSTPGQFWPTAFVQFDAGSAAAPGGYLYLLGGKTGNGTSLYLARVVPASALTQSAWQWFTGTPAASTWGAWASATPIFTDASTPYTPIVGEGTSGSMAYFPVLNRYVLFHSYAGLQDMHVFDAPDPWGPWTTVQYIRTWGGYGTTRALLCQVIAKFTNADNSQFWLAFSGYSKPVNWDNLNVIRGTFTLPSARPPSAPTNFNISLRRWLERIWAWLRPS